MGNGIIEYLHRITHHRNLSHVYRLFFPLAELYGKKTRLLHLWGAIYLFLSLVLTERSALVSEGCCPFAGSR